MEELTKEQIEQSVSAAYDSVNLINKLNSKETKTEEDTNVINRNKEHVKIMLGKDWFVSTLTDSQKLELEEVSK